MRIPPALSPHNQRKTAFTLPFSFSSFLVSSCNVGVSVNVSVNVGVNVGVTLLLIMVCLAVPSATSNNARSPSPTPTASPNRARGALRTFLSSSSGAATPTTSVSLFLEQSQQHLAAEERDFHDWIQVSSALPQATASTGSTSTEDLLQRAASLFWLERYSRLDEEITYHDDSSSSDEEEEGDEVWESLMMDMEYGDGEDSEDEDEKYDDYCKYGVILDAKARRNR